MVKLWIQVLLLVAVLACQCTEGRISYPLIERSNQQPQQEQQNIRSVQQQQQQQTMKLTMSQLEQLKLLSYSDDSAPKQLDAFYLGLYETDGDLPSESLTTVIDGVNAFVLTELNAVYDTKNKPVQSIQTKIVSQATAASSRFRRSVQVTTGSNLETQLNIIFANEPSPDKSEVTSTIEAIFEDTDKLQYLLTNITSRRASDDTELSRVDSIFFWKDNGVAAPTPVDGSAPISAPIGDDGNTDGSITDIEDPKVPVETDSSRNMPSMNVLTPIIVSATIVLVLVALFANHRRRQAHTQRNPVALAASHQISAAELTGGDGMVNLFWESDDIFSVEAALAETSNNTSKSYIYPQTATPATKDFLSDDISTQLTVTAANKGATTKVTTDDQSDIFSGVMSGFLDNFSTLSSPRYMSGTGMDSLESPQGGGVSSSPMNGVPGDSRSVFSFLSGFASKASTVVASNVTPQTQQQQMSNKVATNRNISTSSPVVTDSGVSVAMNPLSPSDGGNRMGGTPHSRVSSLFTFSEEDSEDLVSSSDERSKEPNKPTDLLLRVPSDEEDEDNESLTALAKTTVPIEYGSSTVGKAEAAPIIVNGTSIIVAAAEPELPDRSRSQKEVKQITDKYAIFLDNPALSQDPSTANAANPALIISKGTSSESKPTDCCKDAYASVFKPTQETREHHPGSSVVNEALTDLTLVPNDTLSNQDGFTRLSAEEITKELAAAEAESNRLKRLSTHWTMSMFSSPSVVESPAAKTYNGSRALDLASPSSIVSNKSEPSNLGGNTKMIQLQWDDPNQSSLNRMKAAAFAESVAGNTLSTGKDSASERFTMFTGRKSNTRPNIMNRSFERMSTMSAGHADGTNIYQIDAAEEGSIGSNESMSLRNSADQEKTVAVETPGIESTFSAERTRVHAKNMAGDGTTNYQHETMDEWSVAGDNDDPSLSDSDSAGKRHNVAKSMSEIIMGAVKGNVSLTNTPGPTNDTPRSAATNTSAISGLSMDTTPVLNSDASPSKQLISDLLWLENKIAATNQAILSSPRNQGNTDDRGTEKVVNPLIDPNDSLSFSSNDGIVVTSPGEPETSNDTSLVSRAAASKDDSMSVHQSIVCRDCFAPPGKLKIIIHSTKDGPAVHTVKKGSSLEGHIFAGDLIISVDNVDTRTFSAEQVMKMMTAKTRFERKITVLHFEKESLL